MKWAPRHQTLFWAICMCRIFIDTYGWTSCTEKHCCCFSKRTHKQLGAKLFAAGSLPLGTSFFSSMSGTVFTCRDKTSLFNTVQPRPPTPTPNQNTFASNFAVRDSTWVSHWDTGSYRLHTVGMFSSKTNSLLRRKSFHVTDASAHIIVELLLSHMHLK